PAGGPLLPLPPPGDLPGLRHPGRRALPDPVPAALAGDEEEAAGGGVLPERRPDQAGHERARDSLAALDALARHRRRLGARGAVDLLPGAGARAGRPAPDARPGLDLVRGDDPGA